MPGGGPGSAGIGLVTGEGVECGQILVGERGERGDPLGVFPGHVVHAIAEAQGILGDVLHPFGDFPGIETHDQSAAHLQQMPRRRGTNGRADGHVGKVIVRRGICWRWAALWSCVSIPGKSPNGWSTSPRMP